MDTDGSTDRWTQEQTNRQTYIQTDRARDQSIYLSIYLPRECEKCTVMQCSAAERKAMQGMVW